jgi:hypothetical protein
LYLRLAERQSLSMNHGTRWRPAAVAVLAALALLPRCACDTVPSDAVQKCSTSQVFAGHVKTDILFVIDDSGSMTEEQSNLSTNLGAFIDRLASLPIQDDFQIGVTTTDVDNFDGSTQFSPGHPYPRGAIVAVQPGQPGTFVYDPAAFPSTNGWGGNRILAKGSPTLVQDFKANVLVGTAGSGKEQPFRAVRMALTDRILDGTNAGFLRPGAALAVIIVSDEDDCSDSAVPAAVTSNNACHDVTNKFTKLDPVADFAAFLQGPIRGEVRDTVAASIVGVGEGTLELACVPKTCCTTALDRGDRHVALLQAMGPRSRLASICDASFAASLSDFANAIMSDTLPLEGAPADWRMLVASVTKSDGTKVACKIVPSDAASADLAAADAIYSAPQAGLPASLTFQGNCSLSPGDLIDVNVVCAG